MYLSEDVFTQVIDSTPLVSIDLLIENSQGQVLLGLRTNRPAKGMWFVPGGRILKNESLDMAFSRLCEQELGIIAHRKQASLIGPFEHFYDDCVFSNAVSTHYVVLGYKLIVDVNIDELPTAQHGHYKWFSKREILQDTTVHKHSKWYIEAEGIF
ncbi:GDP-mannose mannosyl hydrolase [Shewanella goraebulensis]|uniref:GDP-mannose mannosyl hydrolase n=1 Tax=Shewanella goraebulensis TaxID=3050637 RepID=UPI00254A883C|nr:GDP-mannose mannosyl hydrolase [Shewanella goraebulensis]